MGALACNRKRVHENLSSQSPFSSPPSLNSPNSYDYSDTIVSKKPRICDNQVVEKLQLQISNCSSIRRTIDILRKYPEPAVLKREVHAPCRPKKRFGSSSLLSSRFLGLKSLVVESPKKNEKVKGNVFGSDGFLRQNLDKAKRNALGTLRHVRVFEEEKEEERKRDSVVSEDSCEVVIIEDGNEVKSVVSDGGNELRNKGLELVLESRDLDHEVLEGSVVTVGNGLDSVEAYKKLLSSVDRSYSTKLHELDFEIKSNEAKLSSQRSLRSLKKELKERRGQELKKPEEPEEDLLAELFMPLTEEDEIEVKHALSNSYRRRVLVNHENSNIAITGDILRCLRPGAWLNDEVINVYLELLKEREKRDPKRFLNCHFFNTFFYKKLIGKGGYDYKSVRRWTTQRKLGYKLVDCDKIFVPIHREVHWCLAVINIKDKTFQYLDSLGGRDLKVLRALAKYYVDEVRDKCGEDIDVSSWDLEFVEDLPEQQNGFDCGVFMIKYADFYSRGFGLQFSQENMPYFRLRTAKEILRLRAD